MLPNREGGLDLLVAGWWSGGRCREQGDVCRLGCGPAVSHPVLVVQLILRGFSCFLTGDDAGYFRIPQHACLTRPISNTA